MLIILQFLSIQSPGVATNPWAWYVHTILNLVQGNTASVSSLHGRPAAISPRWDHHKWSRYRGQYLFRPKQRAHSRGWEFWSSAGWDGLEILECDIRRRFSRPHGSGRQCGGRFLPGL